MDLSIIVVSYNTRALVEQCVLSVERHLEGRLRYEVVVVDNASRDGSPERMAELAATRPWLKVLPLKDNLGFSAGNNAGIREARGRHVLLLNSDAYLVDDSVTAALAFLASRPDIFAVAGLLLNGDGTPGPSYGHFPTAATLARELLTRRFNLLRAVSPDPQEPSHEIDFPCGAYFLMPAGLLKELGGLDEAFFMYFEETDLARRAKDRGYRNWYFAPAKAVHLGGQSAKEVKSLFLVRLYYSNWRRYLRKHHGSRDAFLVRLMLGAYFRLAEAYGLLRGRRELARFHGDHRRALREGWAAPLTSPGSAR